MWRLQARDTTNGIEEVKKEIMEIIKWEHPDKTKY
jgi:hypothetical protein